MKVLILLGLAAVAFGRIENEIPEGGLVGYMSKYAIPLAEKIREAEESVDTARIIGGSAAISGQFPYQAGLLVTFPAGTGVCGASLVSSTRLLTAAHCWFDGRNQGTFITVVLGSVLLFSGGTRLVASNVVMHQQWSPSNVRNDIAAISLPIPVTFTNNIQPISLPSGSELNQNFAGQTAIASGFGRTTSNGQITQEQFLSFVELNVITNTVCRTAFPLYFRTSNICTSGRGGSSTCNGDSGGPLTVESNGRRILVGITSFGSGLGCSSGLPAVYARVTSFMNFINQQL